ncbi:uncharacterized protein LOC117005032 [Catharus ustulatus]|uniref:uncharacterized protein LOC117005032 n=1 Tax=Catharus ustulatus TaxID=91951 RepID=UPI001408470D|nr:uncharacterized protein LOC117005032 [Catharus ustulatus]
MCGKNNTKYWAELDVNVVTPTTQLPVMLTPKFSEIGPYVIRKTGRQQILLNPAWSLKQVKLLMQNNVSEVQPTCSSFLQTSFEGWITWLQKRDPSKKRITRDITGVVGTGLGILNSIDLEALMNKLATTTEDLTKLRQPLQSSLTALGTQQWLLSNILPNWEKVDVNDHKLIVDGLGATQSNFSLALSCIQAQLWIQSVAASIIREGEKGILPTEICKIIWDSAIDFEKEFQSWWNLVNFTYDPSTNTATAFVLTIRNASVHSIFPIISLGLNHDGAVLYPSEHREWARQISGKWQTVSLETCITREQRGFICESNAIRAQDICLDTEQNVCNFEIHPNETPETVLVYIGNDCACLRTACDKQLEKDLAFWEAPSGEGQLLQYVDDLLIATKTQEACVEWTRLRSHIPPPPPPPYPLCRSLPPRQRQHLPRRSQPRRHKPRGSQPLHLPRPRDNNHCHLSQNNAVRDCPGKPRSPRPHLARTRERTARPSRIAPAPTIRAVAGRHRRPCSSRPPPCFPCPAAARPDPRNRHVLARHGRHEPGRRHRHPAAIRRHSRFPPLRSQYQGSRVAPRPSQLRTPPPRISLQLLSRARSPPQPLPRWVSPPRHPRPSPRSPPPRLRRVSPSHRLPPAPVHPRRSARSRCFAAPARRERAAPARSHGAGFTARRCPHAISHPPRPHRRHSRDKRMRSSSRTTLTS